MKLRWSRATLVAIVVAGFSILAALVSYFHPFAFPDEADYWTLARNLVHSGTLSFDGVTPSAYRPPLVAWLLAPLVAMGWSMEMARPAFVILYAAAGVLAGLFLSRIFPSSRWIPPIGTAFILSNPLYFFSAGNLYPQQVLTPLLLLALSLVFLKLESFRAAVLRSIAIGLVAGLSVLASAPALFSFLPVFGFLAWHDLLEMRKGKLQHSCQAVIAVLTLFICLIPYLTRNARQVHPGIYLSLNSGINLLLGNAPLTTPTSGMDIDLSQYTYDHRNDSEFDLNHYLSSAAITNIRENPGYYSRLYLRKLLAGFGVTVQTYTYGYSRPGTLALFVYMGLVWIGVATLLFQLYSNFDHQPLKLAAILVLAAYLLTIAGYAIFFTRLRFRLPVDVALALLSASGWGLLMRKPRTQR